MAHVAWRVPALPCSAAFRARSKPVKPETPGACRLPAPHDLQTFSLDHPTPYIHPPTHLRHLPTQPPTVGGVLPYLIMLHRPSKSVVLSVRGTGEGPPACLEQRHSTAATCGRAPVCLPHHGSMVSALPPCSHCAAACAACRPSRVLLGSCRACTAVQTPPDPHTFTLHAGSSAQCQCRT